LIFVGKWGWDVAGLHEYLSNTDALGNWLYIFNGISDAELEYLYRRCLFTAFVSFAEGWGLPVGESLAHGKPCVASGATSIPEVGGTLVRYVDPYDLRSGYEVIKQLVSDRGYLVRWAQQVQDEFRPRRWQTFCIDFFDVVSDFSQHEATTWFPNKSYDRNWVMAM
jgi:glycosyltransferase involved in cell wall biosynthesis